MIAILADDFTGAAEVGAVALRYGLSAQVLDRFAPDIAADVVVLNTDSRSLPPYQADATVTKVVGPLSQVARWIYKKIDSVLRGPVVAEVQAALYALRLERALLVPANPSLGRTIRQGQYYVGGVPLHQTAFATDAEYPVSTSEVLTILARGGATPVGLLEQGQALPARGIFVGQAASAEDLASWAAKVDARTLPVGGAEFFAAVLEAKGHARALQAAQGPLRGEGPMLIVCGSSPSYAARTIQQARARGTAVLPMPEALLTENTDAPAAMQQWADQVCDALAQRGSAVASIGEGTDRTGRSQTMVDRLADLAAAVLGRMKVGTIFVEGGATAWTLVKRLGWRRFRVHRELAPGVVVLGVVGGGPWVTMKPGSYAWPEEIWP
jgi:uncharacterized protein YgbK (DUF1537 family)